MALDEKSGVTILHFPRMAIPKPRIEIWDKIKVGARFPMSKQPIALSWRMSKQENPGSPMAVWLQNSVFWMSKQSCQNNHAVFRG